MIKTDSGLLYMFFGRKRCGKSTLLTRLAVRALAHGQKVYSTIPIAGTYLFDGKQTGFFQFDEGSLVLIDEVGLVFPSREFKSFKAETRSLFKLQGHYKLTIVICSQSFDVDKAIRDLCDEIYLVKKWFRFLSVCKRVRRSIVVTKATDYGGSTFADQYELTHLPFGRNRIYTFLPLYWKKFDSYAAPKLPNEDEFVKFIEPRTDVKNIEIERDSIDTVSEKKSSRRKSVSSRILRQLWGKLKNHDEPKQNFQRVGEEEKVGDS